MTLESAAAERLSSGLWSGARHVVAGLNLTRLSSHAGMGQRCQCPNGAGGWFARNAAAAMSTWW